LSSLAGFCYTQFTDTFQEANGLLYTNRTPKIPLDDAALATSGSTPEEKDLSGLLWRRNRLELQK